MILAAKTKYQKVQDQSTGCNFSNGQYSIFLSILLLLLSFFLSFFLSFYLSMVIVFLSLFISLLLTSGQLHLLCKSIVEDSKYCTVPYDWPERRSHGRNLKLKLDQHRNLATL